MRQNNYELLKKGDPAALVHIHAKYSRQIYWIGRRLIDDTFVVETLVQDTFLKLWVHRDTIETPKHIFFFLRFVMIRECNYFYSRPKNKFYRNVNSLENFDNYQDYMAGYDPLLDSENQHAQDKEQRDFERIQRVLALLDPEKRHLIELCLKYGFQYTAISAVMGKGSTEIRNEVKMAIRDIKTIIHQGSGLKTERPAIVMKVQGVMTQEQENILRLRCSENYSFAAIAKELNLSQKEVHSEFMTAYKLLQEKQQQQSA